MQETEFVYSGNTWLEFLSDRSERELLESICDGGNSSSFTKYFLKDEVWDGAILRGFFDHVLSENSHQFESFQQGFKPDGDAIPIKWETFNAWINNSIASATTRRIFCWAAHCRGDESGRQLLYELLKYCQKSFDLKDCLHGFQGFESLIEALSLEFKLDIPGNKGVSDPPTAVVLPNRISLRDDEGLGLRDALLMYKHLDFIALSAEVLIRTFYEELRQALYHRDFSCRIVIFDPSPANEADYHSLVVKTLGHDIRTKQGQAAEFFDLYEDITAKFPGKLELKVITNLPLLYNLWLAGDSAENPEIGHLSVYGYDADNRTIAFRSFKGQPLTSRLAQEFSYVWNEVAKSPATDELTKE